MPFHKVEAKKLYIQIADQIVQHVRDGELPPGSKLPSERDLALQMGVSRPSVREALIALELLRVVEIRIGQGTFVVGGPVSFEVLRSLTLVPPLDLIEARQVIEGNVVELLASKWSRGTIKEESFERAYAITEEMKQIVADSSQLEAFYRLALQFHKSLAEASNNEVLSGVVGNLVDTRGHPLWDLINKKVLETREAREGQIQEHETILSAIQQGDGRAAADAMKHHLEELAELVLE